MGKGRRDAFPRKAKQRKQTREVGKCCGKRSRRKEADKQWRNHALNFYSGWAHGVWGTEVWKSQIYTNSSQLSNAFLRRFVAESVLHPPKEKTSDLRESHDPTRPGQVAIIVYYDKFTLPLTRLFLLLCSADAGASLAT